MVFRWDTWTKTPGHLCSIPATNVRRQSNHKKTSDKHKNKRNTRNVLLKTGGVVWDCIHQTWQCWKKTRKTMLCPRWKRFKETCQLNGYKGQYLVHGQNWSTDSTSVKTVTMLNLFKLITVLWSFFLGRICLFSWEIPIEVSFGVKACDICNLLPNDSGEKHVYIQKERANARKRWR